MTCCRVKFSIYLIIIIIIICKTRLQTDVRLLQNTLHDELLHVLLTDRRQPLHYYSTSREMQPCSLCSDKSLSDCNYVTQIEMTSHTKNMTTGSLSLSLLKKRPFCKNSAGRRRLGDLYFRNENHVKIVLATKG